MKKLFIIFYVATFFIVAGLSFAMPAFSAILFYEDFEDTFDFTNDWVISGGHGSQEPTTEQVRQGSKSYKFSLTRYNSGDYREEVILKNNFNNGSNHFTIGNEYWIGFSIFLADGYHSPTETGNWIIHHQYHAVPDKPPTCDPAELARNPNVALETNAGDWISRAKWDSAQYTTSYEGTYGKNYGAFSTGGQWYDFVINVKWSYSAGGTLKIWQDGELVTDHTGGNCFNDDKGPYLKIGIYSHVLDSDQTVTIYYDELRIGDNNSSYAEVVPGGSVKPLPPTKVRIIDK